jgi:hypothetical protein
MENVSNISSEEELLRLRNEGKVSKTEYQDLLATMRKTTKADFVGPATETDKAKSRRRLGMAAFAMMLGGIILPAILVALASNAHDAIVFSLFPACSLEIGALVLGIMTRQEPFGKAAIAISPIVLIILTCLFVLIA